MSQQRGRGQHRGGFSDRGRGDAHGGGRGGRGGPGGGGRGGGPRGPPEIFQASIPAVVPKNLQEDSAQLIKAFKSLSVTPERPLRPGYGTLGTPSPVRANFFALKFPKGPFYDYVVKISPEIKIGRMKGRLFEILEELPQFQAFLPFVAHDRAQRIVSAKELPPALINGVTLTYHEKGRQPAPDSRKYTLSVTLDKKLDMTQLTSYVNGDPDYRGFDVQPYLSALNLILQSYGAHNGARVGGNKFFFRDQNPPSLSAGVEAWRGFFISVRPAFKNLMVNVNVCMTAFIQPGNMVDALKSFQSRQGGLPTLPPRLAKSIKPYLQHLGYKKPLKGIGTTTARQTMFDCEEYGGKISVEQYFKKKYNIVLKHPNDVPVINVGSRAKNIFVPAELCTILPSDPLRGRLSEDETSQMIRLACKPPATNAAHILNEAFPKLGLFPKKDPLNGFGLQVSQEMAVVPLRVLPAPTLQYKPGGKVNVRNASWNTTESSFHTPAGSAGWGVLVVRDSDFVQDRDVPGIQKLAGLFKDRCQKNGMRLGPFQPVMTDPLPHPNQDPGRLGAISKIHAAIKGAVARLKAKPAFFLVMLSRTDNYIYPNIKRICDIVEGIPTITMLYRKVLVKNPNQQDQYVGNVALKLNMKLGGKNHTLDPRSMAWLLKKKTMVVGVDVTHPSPTTKLGTPSVAAVVASTDDSFAQYPASLRIQKPDPNRESKEIVDEFGAMLVERLLKYEQVNKQLPDRILIFRDGVSEGQFDLVIREELAQVHSAFGKVSGKAKGGKYRPTISIIICGKRHHARFFPPKAEFATDNGNTKPGSVVDQGITSVFDFDFYLQAHAGLQGTVRPTHYTVVYDENGLGADEIQQGTHTMSYTYCRATKAVSLIPPAYYADLACERGRCYLNKFFVMDDDRKTATESGKGLSREQERDKTFEAAKKEWGEGVHPDMQGTMFYI